MEEGKSKIIFHLKRDTFKLDEDDTEHYYCKYCKKKMKLKYFKRHNNEKTHKFKQEMFKQDNMTDQIYIRLVDNFEAGKYDPNDVNLVGLEKENRFIQLERETWVKYVKCKISGYFDQYHEDDDLNFEDYDFYYENVIQKDSSVDEDNITTINGAEYKIPIKEILSECNYIRWMKIIDNHMKQQNINVTNK